MMTKKSMAINGSYIEALVDGYTTIGVAGRESLASDIEAVSVNNRHGSIYKGKTYAPRTITVSFAIEGYDTDDLLVRLEELNSILDQEGVRVTFLDEIGRFYYVDAFTNVEVSITVGVASDNAVATGTFDCYCSNPFKYSTTEYLAEPELDEDGYPLFMVDYDGTYKSFPTFEVDFYSKTKTDIYADARDGKEVAYEKAKVYAYKGVALDEEEFETDTYLSIVPTLATAYSEDAVYYTYEEVRELADESEPEDGDEEFTDDPDAVVYILSEEVDEDSFQPDMYYTLKIEEADKYDENVDWYYFEDPEYIPEEAQSDLSSDTNPEEDDISGNANEDLGQNGSCGYVAFVDDNANILQFGNPDIDNIVKKADNEQTLIDSEFTRSTNYSADVEAKWINGGGPNAVYWPATPTEANFSQGEYYTRKEGTDGFSTYTRAESFTADTEYYTKQVRTKDGEFNEVLRENVVYGQITTSQPMLAWTKSEHGLTCSVALEKVYERTATSCKLKFKISIKRTGDTIPKNGATYKKKVRSGKKHKWKTYKHSGTQIVAHITTGSNDNAVTVIGTGTTWSKGTTKNVDLYVTLSELNGGTQTYGGMKFYVSSSGEYNCNVGNKNLKAASLPVYIPMAPDKYYLSPGFVANTGWHGPVITRDIPADSNGDVGAIGFNFEVSGKYCVGNAPNYNLQRGIMGLYVLDANNRIISGMEVVKNDNNATNAYVRCFQNDRQYGDNSASAAFVKYADTQMFTIGMSRHPETGLITYSFETKVPDTTTEVKDKQETAYKNVWVPKKDKKGKVVKNKKGKVVKVKKRQSYKYWTYKPQTVSGRSEMSSVTTATPSYTVAKKVAIAFYTYRDIPHLTWQGITKAKFTKNGIHDREELNIFHPSDQLIVDCNTATVLLNNLKAQRYGALGNDWDKLYLDEGLNQIKVYYSEWAKDPMVYRQCLHSDSWSATTKYYKKQNDDYIETAVTEATYNQDPNVWYIREHVEMTFRMRYREVFI